jgi:hypothetical protein
MIKIKQDRNKMKIGSQTFYTVAGESSVVAGIISGFKIEKKTKEHEERLDLDNILIYGTADCCRGSIGTVNLEIPNPKCIEYPMDTNMFDIQPLVMRTYNVNPTLGLLGAGYGCNGNGVRLVDTIGVRFHDVFNPEKPEDEKPEWYWLKNNKSNAKSKVKAGETEFRVREGLMIRPDIENKKFWIDTVIVQRYWDSRRNNLGDAERYRADLIDAGAIVERDHITYNSVELPTKLDEMARCLHSLDITDRLVKLGVDLEASLELAKHFTKTRKTYLFGGE